MNLVERVRSDASFIWGMWRILRRAIPIAKAPNHSFGDLAETLAARFAERIALTSDRETFTYATWNGRANRYARWARTQGFGKGDTVALLMPNRPEYMSIWLGIAKAGGATALINTNLADAALAHSLDIVAARAIIVEASLLERYASARHLLKAEPRLFVHGAAGTQFSRDGAQRLDETIAAYSEAAFAPHERVALTIDDPCIYVYTSGTTGLPKAANINHYRVQLAMQAFAGFAGSNGRDRVYDCLPMYHTNGGVVAPGIALAVGGTCVIRERFSARDFWPDIQRHRCTIFVYIGEMCRYLLLTPPGEADRGHQVRLCVGNGLRPDVWRPFCERFGLKVIREFYASTEGNCSVFNLDSKPEAVGRMPRWALSRFPIRVIRFDIGTEDVVRDAAGLCIPCADDEVGEVVGQILADPARPGNRFEGYSDRAATEKKVLRDVFKTGDAWFRTGDLMRRDRHGYFYFVDRIGDTFRWKGENVATSEVAEALTAFAGVNEANVYGVAVPGTEGRAGMACLVLADPAGFDLAAFAAFLCRRLPPYAVPVFLRFTDHTRTTSTFKQRKVELVAQGFDPAATAEPLFYFDTRERNYRPLEAAAFAAIGAGLIRL